MASKEKYWESSVDKQMLISVVGTNIAIDNSMLESGTFSLEESLCSESELKFGCCEANSVKFTAHNTAGSLVGKTISISETLDGDTDNPTQYGVYKVYSDIPTSDRTKRQITAYDAMYDIINADVKAWYAGLNFPMTLKAFRDSFFAYLGIEQEDIILVNDDMTVNKTLVATQTDDSSAITEEPSISGKTVVTAICEINGCFGNINRDGKFEYVILPNIISAVYPAEDLYPRNDLFPSDANTESISGYYITFDYEDFKSKAITQLEIRPNDSSAGAFVGTPGNNYVISGNFLVSDKTGAELEQIANNVFPIMKQAAYTPLKSCTCVGNPCLNLGDPIRFNTTREIVETYILQRTLIGVQSKRDSIAAQGTETHSAKVNSMRETLESVQRRTSKLERNADHLLSQYEDLESSTSSKFEQTAKMIQTEVSNRQNADNAMSSQIQQTASAISSKVSYGEVVSEINQTSEVISLRANHLEIDCGNFKVDKDTGNAAVGGEISFYEDFSESHSGELKYGRLPGGGGMGFYVNSDFCARGNVYASDGTLLASYSDLTSYAKKSSPTLSNPTLTGDIDAIGVKGRSSSAAANVRCQDSSTHGYLAIAATSSKRYKHDIADVTDDKLNPKKLYELPFRQFVYNLDYLSKDDQRYGQTVCGFIAEEVEKEYPVACEYNSDGNPENWDVRYIVPPMLALIQEQYKEIELLKQENNEIKDRLSALERRVSHAEDL